MMSGSFIAIALSFPAVIALKTNGATQKGIPISHELPLQHQAAAVPPTINHEIPEAALKVSAWTDKIPDINDNLVLAQQWMSVGNQSKSVAVGNLLLHSHDDIEGALSMVAGDVKDAPKYYNCGLVMNTAWGAMARNPCSMQVWEASDKMKEMVPECSKLRVGKRYSESYRALKIDQDTWCGGPFCDPKCAKGVKCFRSFEFPFMPVCERYPENVTVADESEPQLENIAVFAELTCGIMMCICIGFAVVGCMRKPVIVRRQVVEKRVTREEVVMRQGVVVSRRFVRDDAP